MPDAQEQKQGSRRPRRKTEGLVLAPSSMKQPTYACIATLWKRSSPGPKRTVTVARTISLVVPVSNTEVAVTIQPPRLLVLKPIRAGWEMKALYSPSSQLRRISAPQSVMSGSRGAHNWKTGPRFATLRAGAEHPGTGREKWTWP